MKLSFDLSSASVPAELKVYLEARKPLTAVLQSLATFGSKLPDLEMRLGSELMNAPARTRSHTGKRLTIDDKSELGILILSLHRRLRLSCSHVFELLSVIYWKSSQPPAALGPQAAPEPRAVPPSLPTSLPQSTPKKAIVSPKSAQAWPRSPNPCCRTSRTCTPLNWIATWWCGSNSNSNPSA